MGLNGLRGRAHFCQVKFIPYENTTVGASLVALSSNGDRVAVVDIVNQVIHVYHWETTPSESWNQLANFFSIASVALSRDGRFPAIGGITSDGSNVSHNVSVFQYLDEEWTKLGSDIVNGSSSLPEIDFGSTVAVVFYFPEYQ
jgi:hypothetical protein